MEEKGYDLGKEIDFNSVFASEIQSFYEMASSAQNILLVSHQKPDGDTSGSAMAMAEMFEKYGKKVTLFSPDPLADEFHFLPRSSEYIHQVNPNKYDFIIMFDGGTYKMLGLHEKYPEIFFSDAPVFNIDHHISNEMYGKWNMVDVSAASTTIVVARLFRALGWTLSPIIATPLLMGLYTDTGSLMHSNSSSATYREAARMLAAGADLQRIVKSIFKTKTFKKLKLWGKVLSRIDKGLDKIVTSYVKEKDFTDLGATADDLTGVVDYLNSIPDSRFSILFTEKGDKIKGSMRTLLDEVDLTQVAGVFGGGGHKKASGFTVPGRLTFERRWNILSNDHAQPQNFDHVM